MAKTRQTTAATRHTKTTDTPLDKHETFIWDAEVPQLAQRRRGAARSWIIQTRVGGRSLRRKIGDTQEIPVEVARALARDLLAEIAAEAAPDLAPGETVAGFAPRFLDDCAGQWKPGTLTSHRQARSFPVWAGCPSPG